MTAPLDDALETYIRAHIEPEPDVLHLIDRRSHLRLVNGQMVSGHLQGRMLKMLTAMLRPHRVVEVGTFTGYSALCLAEGLASDNDRVITLEANDELEDLIRENLALSPYGCRVEPIIGRRKTCFPRSAPLLTWLSLTPTSGITPNITACCCPDPPGRIPAG